MAKRQNITEKLYAQIEAAYAAWLVTVGTRDPLVRKEARAKRKGATWGQLEKIRGDFNASKQGEKHAEAWRAYNVVSNKAWVTSGEIRQREPRTLQGLANFAMATAFREMSGFGFGIDSVGFSELTLSVVRLAGVKISPALRRALVRSADLPRYSRVRRRRERLRRGAIVHRRQVRAQAAR